MSTADVAHVHKRNEVCVFCLAREGCAIPDEFLVSLTPSPLKKRRAPLTSEDREILDRIRELPPRSRWFIRRLLNYLTGHLLD